MAQWALFRPFNRHLRLLATVFCVVLASAGAATAQDDVLILVEEVDGNVSFGSEGTLDISGLGAPVSTTNPGGTVFPGRAFNDGGTFLLGPLDQTGLDVEFDMYVMAFEQVIPAFGTSGLLGGSSATGLSWGIMAAGTALYVPPGYDGTANLRSTLLFEDTTLDKLGVIPGTYKTTLKNGDTIAMVVFASDAVAPIPVPAALPLLATALFGLALFRRRRG